MNLAHWKSKETVGTYTKDDRDIRDIWVLTDIESTVDAWKQAITEQPEMTMREWLDKGATDPDDESPEED